MPACPEGTFLFDESVCVRACPSTFYQIRDGIKRCIDECPNKTFRGEDVDITVDEEVITVANFECWESCKGGTFLNKSTNECVEKDKKKTIYYYQDPTENVLINEDECIIKE